MLETIGLIATLIAIRGVQLNNNHRRACFLFWIISNGMTLGIHVAAGIWSLALRDLVFLGYAVAGWRKWGRPQ